MNDDVSVSSYRGGKVRVERDVQGVVPVHSWVIESAGTDVGSKLKRKKVNWNENRNDKLQKANFSLKPVVVQW